jgi:hypothetical protein
MRLWSDKYLRFDSQEWFDRARSMSQRSLAMYNESNRIRNNTSITKQKLAENDVNIVKKVCEINPLKCEINPLKCIRTLCPLNVH